MRTATITKNIYTFDELSKEAKEVAINGAISYIMEQSYEDVLEWWPEAAEAIDKADKMQTPWFAGSYIYDECFETVVLPIVKDWEYLENGKYWSEQFS